MSENKFDTKKLSMFYPKTKKGLLIDYPELKKIEAFVGMNKNELLFSWYYGCKSSPFDYEEDSKVKAEKSFIEAFGSKQKEGLESSYIAGNFPEKVRVAITEMQKFEIGPRVRSKIMIEKIMTNYEQLVDIDVKTEFKDKDDEEDWSKKKAYIDSCAKISSTLPTLINQAEGGFGITEKEEGDVKELDSSSIIDTFHENN